MIGWLEGSPAKRKTRRGVLRFANGWLAKEQDKGGTRGYQPQNQDIVSNDWTEDLGL